MVATMSSTKHDGQYYIDVEQYFQRWAILATTGNTEDNGQYRRRGNTDDGCNDGQYQRRWVTTRTMGNTDDGCNDRQYQRRWAIPKTMGNTVGDRQYLKRWAILATMGNTTDDGQYTDEGQY